MRRQIMKQKHIEITEYEDKALKLLMKKGGYLKEAHLIRDLIMNTVPIEYPKETFEALLTELHKIGVNINQLAHMANATGIVDAEEFKKQGNQLADLALEIKKAVYEPYKKRDAAELAYGMQFWMFDDIDDEVRMQILREEILKLLEKSDQRKKASSYGNDKDMDHS